MLLHVSRRLPGQIDETSGDVALHTGPLFHIGGVQTLIRAITVGDTLVMPEGRFDPAEALRLIERYKITRWSAVPTMVSRVLDHPDVHRRDLRSLRSVTVGGAPVHAEFLERLRTGLPGVQVRVPTGYGLTENGGQATAASGRDTAERPGSSGRPLPCVELKFLPRPGLPDGEILVRASTQMIRYYGNEQSPIDVEGWLHTGDLGHLDDGGHLWITGRSKEMIIRGGENIAPAAVEAALMSLPGIVEAAVIGVPHPDLGEEVMAFVVVEEEQQTPEQVESQLRGNVSSFAVPGRWRVQREPLPTNHAGKVDKTALAALARMQYPGRGSVSCPRLISNVRPMSPPQGRSGGRRMTLPQIQHVTPPFRTFCGSDALAALPRELNRLGVSRAVLFCDPAMLRYADVLGRVETALGERLAGRFDGIREHSPVAAVEDGRRALAQARADAVIVLGGGSAIVTARAATILLAEQRDVRELCTRREADGRLTSPRLVAPKLPQWVVPSTPITAYARAGSAVQDPATGERLALYDPKTRAQGIFLDPEWR